MIKSPKRNIKGKIGNKTQPLIENKLNESEEMNGSFENDGSDKKKKKPFQERVGDWVCIKCKNLNFSFRVVCNRCQLPKVESDKMLESYLSSIANISKSHDMQPNNNVVVTPQQFMMPTAHRGLINNNSININNNYYNNNYPQKNMFSSPESHQQLPYKIMGNSNIPNSNPIWQGKQGHGRVPSGMGGMKMNPFQMGESINQEEGEDEYYIE
jgi:hypothetical protein